MVPAENSLKRSPLAAKGGLWHTAILVACFAAITPCSLQAQGGAGKAQVGPPGEPPRSWVEAAAANEELIIKDDGTFPLRYRVRKIDAKGDTVREVVESQQGSVARLVERNGQPITADEDAAEKERLNAVLSSPEDFIKHHKRDNSVRDYSLQLVRLMPEAMIYTYAPGQPQPAGVTARQIVLDFHADPAFKPPTTIAQLLTGLEGRMWIDAKSRRLTRVEGRVVRPVNFGWGVLARIYPGGAIEFEQANPGGERWVYSHVDEHLTIREMMIKTVPENSRMTASDFRLLPTPVSFQDAVHLLLAMPLTLR